MINKIAVVIPTYNEQPNIISLITSLREKLPGIRIFVVDDNSPDGTAESVRNLSVADPKVRLIWRQRKMGLASAYLDAFARIIPDETIEYIVTMDADFSHRPEDLARMIRYLPDYDLVIGSRYVPDGTVDNWSYGRHLVSKWGNLYAKFVTNLPINDLTAGFVIYHREILGRILMQGVKSDAYGYQIEMKFLASRARARILEVPIKFLQRGNGKSKFGWQSVWEGIMVPWHLRITKR